MRTRIAVILSAFLILCSCSTESLYSWYKYEDVTYKYQKTASDELLAKTMNEYQRILSKQSGVRGAVPPGINAEYGFLLYKTGKKSEGIEYLKKEMQIYPESEVFISRIVKQLEK